MKSISGFSKLSKTGKLRWVAENFFKDPKLVASELTSFWHGDNHQQKVFDDFSENTLSNYYMPYGVAPNFIINGKTYCIPMVIEESSVVAAAASSAKFWATRGGFKAEIIGTTKIGQVHFTWEGSSEKLNAIFPDLKAALHEKSADLTKNMRNRGGGILSIDLIDMTHLEENYYQLKVKFETCDSMGANFINSVLERFGQILQTFMFSSPAMKGKERDVIIIMAILSNYTPECLVRAYVECPIEDLGTFDGGKTSAELFAYKFDKAVKIANIDPYRATTHNKGIFNGIDAVVLATANDFRAVEACGHTYAARDGQYRSLTKTSIENGIFKLWLDIPMAVGTVGGLTSLHPLAKRSLEMLGNPSAKDLMSIIATVGLAQTFAAVKSLTTTGIQKGHMKMHLMNILNHLEATEKEVNQAVEYFKERIVSFTSVREFLNNSREVVVINN
ncbi:MAG: hydroxymethylglutaryl-CoA reductase, degradative [Saprospiraceae bacterium]